MSTGLTVTTAFALGAIAWACSASCANSGETDCNDGVDNDSDGLTDEQDPGCAANGNVEAPDPITTLCSDNLDNDGDGHTDYPNDPGCDSREDDSEFNLAVPQCRDGIDNDNDGKIDFPDDPGCLYALSNSEQDECPGARCPACANGLDDDGDGDTDYPDDVGCDGASDTDEFNNEANDCGVFARLLPLPADGMASGTANGGPNDIIGGCGGAGQESVYRIEVEQPLTLVITTDFPETTLDTVVYVRTTCRDPLTELSCNDDSNGVGSRLTVNVDVGAYFIVVDSHDAGAVGDFRLQVDQFLGPGANCDPDNNQCAPDLFCQKQNDAAAQETCQPPRCNDGFSNDDGDTLIDFPNDPGCESAQDNDESDSCPGMTCPECANGEDDDLDGATDFSGGDPGCTSAADNNEIDVCVPDLAVVSLPSEPVTAQTVGSSLTQGSCSSSTGPEDVYSLRIDRDDLIDITASTLGSTFDTVLYVRQTTCGDPDAEVACADPDSGGEVVTILDPDAGTYFIFVDGANNQGEYTLAVTGTIPAAGACDPFGRQFTCASGFFCEPTTLTCEPAACNDGVDADDAEDTLIDYPNDPGCDSPSDNDESDNCPDGPDCPQCGNGVDDDGDMLIDYNSDSGCSAASDDIEEDCDTETDGLLVLDSPTISGSTADATNDFTPQCSSSTARDVVFTLTVPGALTSLRLDTDDSVLDTVLSLKFAECSATDLVCDDDGLGSNDSVINATNLEPGSYFIIVDGWSSSFGDFNLNTSGVIRAGALCDEAQVTSGLLRCEDGHACRSGSCQLAACNNGVDDDDDEDTLADYPNDPGCSSRNDDDESDECPTAPAGPHCPACSNGFDDDFDGVADYPADPGCMAAGDTNEIDECIDDVEVILLTDAGTLGTTPPTSAGSNFSPSCHASTTSTETVLSYRNTRALKSLSFSTLGSPGDTVLSARFANCGDEAAEVACAHDENSGERITIDSPNLGWYFVFVDGDFSSEIDYVANVAGVISIGDSCDPTDTQFVCETGAVCETDMCVPTVCNNGMDDDGDNLADDLDPGCTSLDDDSEAPNPDPLPQCSNNIDDDSDGAIDYPEDTGCGRASDDIESNCDQEVDQVLTITAPTTADTTVSGSDDFEPGAGCQSNSNAPDRVLRIRFPGDLAQLTANTNASDAGFDTVLSVKHIDCSATSLACDDDGGNGFFSSISVTDVPKGPYYFVIDGYSSNNGGFALTLSATVKSGQECDPQHIASGIATCEGDTTCTDTGTAHVCQ